MTTIASLAFIPIGMYSPVYSDTIINMGLFATSGAITNWVAIHMLFEKIPFLYGSGVIPLRFNEFKSGIQNMMMSQFFTKENIDRFLAEATQGSGNILNPKAINDLVDHDHFFNKLVETVNESQLGGMLAMFGGSAALEPLRSPFAEKMESALIENMSRPEFKEGIKKALSTGGLEGGENVVQTQIASIVETRLDELTPTMVKEIIQEMIREHLGWLVLWGGVFGAILGIISSMFF